MTGRPGHRAMEMNGNYGRSAVSYLVCTARMPFFMLVLIGPETKSLLAFQGRRGIASVVQWNPRPVIFGVETTVQFHGDLSARYSHRVSVFSNSDFEPILADKLRLRAVVIRSKFVIR